MAPPLPSWTIIWPCQESSKMTQRGLECEKGDPRSSWSQEREKERERKKEGDRECRRSPSNLSPPFRSGNPDAPSRGFLGLSPLERISARQCWTLRSRRKHERKAHGASKGALAPRRNFFVNSILLSLFFLPSLHFQVRSFPHRHHQQQQFSPRPRRSARSASVPGGPTRTRRDRRPARRGCGPGPVSSFEGFFLVLGVRSRPPGAALFSFSLLLPIPLSLSRALSPGDSKTPTVYILTMPTPGPGCTLVPRCLTTIAPAFAGAPPPSLTPSIFGSWLPLLLVEPPCFFVALFFC